QENAASEPIVGNGDFALVPGRGDPAKPHLFPARMNVKRLGILLHVVGEARPAPGHFEETPSSGRDLRRFGISRLPAPQAVETNPLSSWRRLVVRLGDVPDGLDAVG